MRMSETIKPYRAKASPKISIRIKPTNKRYCWAFALIPASPTFPIEYPAAWVSKSVRCSWIRKLDLRPYENNRFSWDSRRLASLYWWTNTSLTDDDGHNHAVNTQNTGHDHGDQWFHDNSWSPDWDATDAGTCLCSSIGSTEVYLLKFLLARTRAMLTPIKPKKEAGPPASGTGKGVLMLIGSELIWLYLIKLFW